MLVIYIFLALVLICCCFVLPTRVRPLGLAMTVPMLILLLSMFPAHLRAVEMRRAIACKALLRSIASAVVAYHDANGVWPASIPAICPEVACEPDDRAVRDAEAAQREGAQLAGMEDARRHTYFRDADPTDSDGVLIVETTHHKRLNIWHTVTVSGEVKQNPSPPWRNMLQRSDAEEFVILVRY